MKADKRALFMQYRAQHHFANLPFTYGAVPFRQRTDSSALT
jgi:hypothetical protein